MIDVLFGLGSICFSIALIPAVLRHQPPPFLTCLLTWLWLAVFAGCYLKLGYGFSFVAGSCTAGLWLILMLQAIRQERLWWRVKLAASVLLGDIEGMA